MNKTKTINNLTFRLINGSYQRGGLTLCGERGKWTFEATSYSEKCVPAKSPEEALLRHKKKALAAVGRELERIERVYGND